MPLKPSTVQTKPDQKVPVTNGKQRVKGTPAKGRRSSLDSDILIKVGGKNSSIAGKPKIAPKPTGKSNTQAPNATKPPAAAGKPKNPAQVAKPPATTQ